MKKVIYLLFLSFFILFVSCSKDNDSEPYDPELIDHFGWIHNLIDGEDGLDISSPKNNVYFIRGESPAGGTVIKFHLSKNAFITAGDKYDKIINFNFTPEYITEYRFPDNAFDKENFLFETKYITESYRNENNYHTIQNWFGDYLWNKESKSVTITVKPNLENTPRVFEIKYKASGYTAEKHLQAITEGDIRIIFIQQGS